MPEKVHQLYQSWTGLFCQWFGWNVFTIKTTKTLVAIFMFSLIGLIGCNMAFARGKILNNSLPVPESPAIQLTLPKVNNAPIFLEVRATPLVQILKKIADKTGAQIHYSILPEAPVTATCVGANVGQVMDCLVAKQVGLVAHKPQKDKPAEFWLLGSSVGSCQAVTVMPTPPIQPTVETQFPPEQQTEMERVMQEQSDEMLKLAHSKDPNERYSAISNLGSVGTKDDLNVDKALRDAMNDKDTNVRTQAIAAIVQRGGDDVADQLGQALKDKDANVRLSAVSVATDAVILQQALADNDPGVRDLAQSRLDELTANRR